MAKMLTTWQAMLDVCRQLYRATQRSRQRPGGRRRHEDAAVRRPAARPCPAATCSEVIADGALSMAESNACMRRIVAAPTAGACGVLPAVLLPLCKYEELSAAPDAARRCMSPAASARSSPTGPASPALPAAVRRRSARPPPWRRGRWSPCGAASGEQIGHAVAMALKNLMGLVCDPVAGLVEVPCVKRNVIGAVNAVSCGGYGAGGHRKPHPRGRGHRRHGRGGPPYARGVPGDGAGRSGRHAHRQGHHRAHTEIEIRRDSNDAGF